METKTKICSKCGDEKTLDDFPFSQRHKNNRANPCKACKLKQSNAWRDRNRDHVNELARRRFQTPKVKSQNRERRARWRQRHPLKQAEELRKLRANHREKCVNQKEAGAANSRESSPEASRVLPGGSTD